MVEGAHVDLAAGVYAVLGVVVAALIVALTVHLLRRPQEPPVCAEPDSGGAHPLEAPDPAGVQACSCGTVRRIPRTDTTELIALPLAAVPELPLEELPTDVRPALHLVWPPAPGQRAG